MSKELVIVTVIFIVVWVYSTMKIVKPSEMLNKYYMLMSKDLIGKYTKKYNFYTRIKQFTLIGFIGYLIYYFCFK